MRFLLSVLVAGTSGFALGYAVGETYGVWGFFLVPAFFATGAGFSLFFQVKS